MSENCLNHESSGYISIIGRPNVGKSTLFNSVMGAKFSIVTKKSHTTRTPILATLKTKNNKKIIFIDTPGMHEGKSSKLNKLMNKASKNWLLSSDVNIFMIVACKWTNEDELIYKQMSREHKPIILVINKVDTIKDNNLLYEFVSNLTQNRTFSCILPLSATKNYNVDKLLTILESYAADQLSVGEFDDNVFRQDLYLKEIIREKILIQISEEIPYSCFVALENKEDKENVCVLSFIIYVDNSNQKKIIIGKGGGRLKRIGTAARGDMEKHLNKKVYLNLWVKTKPGWKENNDILNNLML